MSQFITAALEVSEAAFTPTPSRIPNIADTVHRHQVLLQEMTSRAEAFRRAADVQIPVMPPVFSPATLAPRPAASLQVVRSALPAGAATNVSATGASVPVGDTVKTSVVIGQVVAAAANPLVSAASNLVAMIDSLSASPVLAEMQKALSAELPDAAPLASSVGNALRVGNVASLESYRGAITSTLARSSDIVRRAHELMAGREVEATRNALVSSFQELGYGQVREVLTGGARIIKARKGTTAFVAKLDPAGTLKLDATGFSGRECEPAVAELITTLASHGLLVRKREALFHGRDDGGELVRETAPLFDPLAAGSPAPAAAVASSLKTADNSTASSNRRTAARRLAART